MDSIVHGVAKSWTQLSDFHFTSVASSSCLLRNTVHNLGSFWLYLLIPVTAVATNSVQISPSFMDTTLTRVMCSSLQVFSTFCIMGEGVGGVLQELLGSQAEACVLKKKTWV